MLNPRSTSPGSNMPAYPWLADRDIHVASAENKLALMQKLGVPYTNEQIDQARIDQEQQATAIVKDLAAQGVDVVWKREIVALIAYLQRLGRDDGIKPDTSGTATASRTLLEKSIDRH